MPKAINVRREGQNKQAFNEICHLLKYPLYFTKLTKWDIQFNPTV